MSASGSPLPRPIEGIYGPPPIHWVGDGFRVHGYFSAMPDAMRRLDPFLMLDYHPPHNYPPTQKRRGVGVHPHRGFETVTIAWQGSVSHHDSAGGGGTIGPGDVQWMTAASGVLHKEYHEKNFAAAGGIFHMAQLWVNLPRDQKMSPPRYQAILASQMGQVLLPNEGGRVTVIAGEYQGVKGPALTFSAINMLDIHLHQGGSAAFAFPSSHNTALLVIDGVVSLNSAPAKTNDFVIFKNEEGAIELQASTSAHVLLLDGAPLGEPIVPYGPFVMNTKQEIMQAFADLQNGKFGHLED